MVGERPNQRRNSVFWVEFQMVGPNSVDRRKYLVFSYLSLVNAYIDSQNYLDIKQELTITFNALFLTFQLSMQKVGSPVELALKLLVN